MEDEVGNTQTQAEKDAELDSWFDEPAEEEDQSADDTLPNPEDSSPSDEGESHVPDDEAQTPDESSTDSLGGGESTGQPNAENPYQWVEALDPAFRDKVDELVQSDRSQKGRVAALQRQLDSVNSEREAWQRTQPNPAATQAVGQGKAPEDMTDEELDTFLEEYPSVAKNVEKLIERRVSQEREEILGQVRPIQEDALRHKLEERRTALRKEAEYIFNTAETGIHLEDVLESRAFRDWVASQPQEYQTFAQSAESVEAASKVLYDFATFTEQQVSSLHAAEQERAAQERATRSRATADETAIRRSQARQGTAPPSRSAITTTGDDGDFDALFNSLVEADEAAGKYK